MIRKSGTRFSEKIMLKKMHDPEKWNPVFRKDHAPQNCPHAFTAQRNAQLPAARACSCSRPPPFNGDF